MYICIPCVCNAHRDQKGELNLLEKELQMVVSCESVLGPLEEQAGSPAPLSTTLGVSKPASTQIRVSPGNLTSYPLPFWIGNSVSRAR